MPGPAPHDPLDEATVDLLVKQVTEGLSPAEQRALDVLDGAVTSVQLQDFERAAAAITLAASAGPKSMPDGLARRLVSLAAEHIGGEGTGALTPAENVVNLAAARRAAAAAAVPAAAAAPRAGAAAGSGLYGWFAAAACLLLALFAWNRAPPPGAPVAQAPPPLVAPQPAPSVPATPAEERAALLASSSALKITFGPTKDPAAAGVTGDVVWDPVTQRGFMHFVGLAANDPALRQYQLWIFDGGRDPRYPVDGGVFNMPSNQGEVVIPIHAALPVLSAKAFAVTIEKPGGVVVSGREHVVVLGSAG
jgi:hypothetical protein